MLFVCILLSTSDHGGTCCLVKAVDGMGAVEWACLFPWTGDGWGTRIAVLLQMYDQWRCVECRPNLIHITIDYLPLLLGGRWVTHRLS